MHPQRPGRGPRGTAGRPSAEAARGKRGRPAGEARGEGERPAAEARGKGGRPAGEAGRPFAEARGKGERPAGEARGAAGRPSAEDTEAALARRAGQQHGLLARGQLLEAGVGPAAIAYRVRSGRLHPVHRGVYALGYVSRSPLTRAMAAVLACGSGSLISHRSAAALWEIGPVWRGPVDVTAPRPRHHRGVVTHRSCVRGRREATVHLGIPVTTVARTLIDLADVVDARALARAVNEAQVQGRVRLEELRALLGRSPGRLATLRLRPILERTGAPTRSALEDLFLEFARGASLPRPETNQRVAGHEVDMLWRRERLIVELDGQRFHDHPGAFERDRDRDATLLAEGYRVVRVTWQRLERDPVREARRLRAILARPTPE